MGKIGCIRAVTHQAYGERLSGQIFAVCGSRRRQFALIQHAEIAVSLLTPADIAVPYTQAQNTHAS